MASSGDCKLNLNLLIEKKSQKVLFAEVGKDVVDFLFSLLSLPLGSVIKQISEESVLGSLRNTYTSWNQLSDSILVSTKMKPTVLIPNVIPSAASSSSVLLFSHAHLATAKDKAYRCGYGTCSYFTDTYQTSCRSCAGSFNSMTSGLSYVGPNVTKEQVEKDGYVKDGFTYAVMDDLSVVPMTALASLMLVDEMGYKDLSLLEQKLSIWIFKRTLIASTMEKYSPEINREEEDDGIGIEEEPNDHQAGQGQAPNISELKPVTKEAYGGGMYATEDTKESSSQSNKGKEHHPRASATQSADGPEKQAPEPKHKLPPSTGDRDLDITGQSYIQ